jgi:two-component system, NarL family, sensor kinase
VSDDLIHMLQERVKELTALHRTARILQDETKPISIVLQEIADILPAAWQYPEITCARIHFQDYDARSSRFLETPWLQRASFTTADGGKGTIDICYREERSRAGEGPFLKEERELIESLAEMLRSYFQHTVADQALKRAHDELERLVQARTQQLRQLASELSLAEARERRMIAEDLHDHIGQALAFIKLQISHFRGNAIFCGFEAQFDKIITLVNQTIQYARDLTVEISPPVLYELGLEAALVWLGERLQRTHGLSVRVVVPTMVHQISEDAKVTLFKAVQELLTNAAKHSGANRVDISLREESGFVAVCVSDDGGGFDPSTLGKRHGHADQFGLFSIRERVSYLGGQMKILSRLGGGSTITVRVPIDREDRHFEY